MPTGEFAPKPTTRAGLGYWATMFTLGGTWYIDSAKTWSVGAFNRYEINTEQEQTDTTTGNAWTLEWGVGEAINATITIGAAGYYQAKVTGDSGTNPQPLNSVAAVGPEVAFRFARQNLVLALRYDYEFTSENRAQGHTGAIVLTKRL
jgi:hypothetical protein